MKSFIYLNIYKLILFLFLITISIYPTINQFCNYNNNNQNLNDYLKGTSEEKKKKCIALSNYFGNELCCYDSNSGDCLNKIRGTKSSENYECPEETIVPNNCGMAGIYQPKSPEICKEISLVQGFCCYVKLNINSTESSSCLRIKKITKDKKMESNEIKDFVNLAAKGLDIGEIVADCKSFKLSSYWILNFIKILFLFY